MSSVASWILCLFLFLPFLPWLCSMMRVMVVFPKNISNTNTRRKKNQQPQGMKQPKRERENDRRKRKISNRKKPFNPAVCTRRSRDVYLLLLSFFIAPFILFFQLDVQSDTQSVVGFLYITLRAPNKSTLLVGSFLPLFFYRSSSSSRALNTSHQNTGGLKT